MRQSYQSSSQDAGMAPIILLLLGVMSLMVAYLVIYGDMSKARQTPRVYVTELNDRPAAVSRER